MREIAVFGNSYINKKENQIKHLFQVLRKIDAKILIDREFYNFIKQNIEINIDDCAVITDNNFKADIALSIGGDGTFLRTAEKIADKEIPILGINVGRLGFLADVPVNDIDAALLEIYKNDFNVEDRNLLELHISNYSKNYKRFALNEVAILKRDNSSMITIHVDIDNHYLNSYEADGLIIATPTGSTAYSLSVGGPILEPTANNFVLSPVAAHTLTMRPLVITNNYELTANVQSRTNSFQVSIDGTAYTLSTNNLLSIKKAPYTIKVVKRKNHTFFETLRDKLMWGLDKRV
ncbi:MAG: NAD kinase [Bacteroidales bacterium]|nr:NAD kinase [Bacteroidales bacterium]